jgi:hypothetical protein
MTFKRMLPNSTTAVCLYGWLLYRLSGHMPRNWKRRVLRRSSVDKHLPSLGILGPNVRAYLGDDLKDVNAFYSETAM